MNYAIDWTAATLNELATAWDEFARTTPVKNSVKPAMMKGKATKRRSVRMRCLSGRGEVIPAVGR